jgi:hypothetical protein
MFRYKEIGLILILILAFTPFAFLLMPLIVATVVIGGLTLLVRGLVRH